MADKFNLLRVLGLGREKLDAVTPSEMVGGGGTLIVGGYVDEGERNSELAGVRKYRTYSEVIANTGIVFASVRYFLTLAGKPDWSFEPVDDSAAAREAAELVEESLHSMPTPFKRVVRRAALYPIMGFSAQEWAVKRRADGRLVFSDIQVRPAKTIERWGVRESGEVDYLVQRPPNGSEIMLPRWKMLYIVADDLTDSPLGLGVMRAVVPAARRQERYEQLEGYGFEGDLRGVPVGRAPYALLRDLVAKKKIAQADMDAALAPLEDFVKLHIVSPKLGLVLDSTMYETRDDKKTPSGAAHWGIDLLKHGANSQPDVAKAIHRLDLRMARLLGGEGLMLGADSTGSLALARDKSSNIADSVEATLGDVAGSMRQDLARPLLMLNGIDPELAPYFKPRRVLGRDVQDIAASLRDLSAAGIQLGIEDEAVGEIFDSLGLTRPSILDREQDSALNKTPDDGGEPEAPEEPEEPEPEA